MKLKQIIGTILMIVLTLTGIILSLGTALVIVLNSDGIISSMIRVDYLEKSEEEAYKVLQNYMSYEKAEEILQNISVKSHIRELATAFDNNTVLQVANEKKSEMKQKIIEALDEGTSVENKESFADVISNEYIKEIFPVTEFNILSDAYKTYKEKIVISLVVIAIIVLVCYIYLALGKKTYKWAIIALYNIMIINIMVVIVLGALNGIVIGNERTTSVILNIISTIKTNLIGATVITLVIAVVSNYLAYFRKRKHSK